MVTTTTSHFAEWLPLLAVITAFPEATAVTTPLSTVATFSSELLQLMTALLLTFPDASYTRAVSFSLAPASVKEIMLFERTSFERSSTE